MTMKEIAALAGVSTATVSHVINGTKHIRPATERRVLDAIRQAGYMPNTLAKSLRQGRTRMIGLLAEDVRALPFASVASGIAEVVQDAGYQLVLHDLHLLAFLYDHYEQIALHRETVNHGIATLLAAHVDGILYVGMHDRHLDGIVDPISKPLVFAYSHGNGEDPFVSYDGLQGAAEATQHLIQRGHQRIALIAGHPQAYPTMQRLSGFQIAMQQAGLPIPEGFVRYGNWTQASGDNETETLLSFPEPPTAILALNDEMAAGCLRAAAARGRKVPRDLSIVGFDDRAYAAFLSPALTTVQLPHTTIGQDGARMLLSRLNEEPPIPSHLLPCALVSRTSVAPPSDTIAEKPIKKPRGRRPRGYDESGLLPEQE